MNEHRPGSDPQTEHRVLARPLGRSIAQTRDADPARQSPLDGSLHEFGREEGERDCHIDLPKAAFVPRGNLLDSGDGAGNALSKPTSAARDRCDERRAGLGAYRSTVVWRRGSRHDDFASPLHWRLFPRDAHDGSLIVHEVGRITAGCRCIQLDDQLMRFDLDADDVLADEVSISTLCGVFEMHAHGRADQSLHFGRGHPAHAAGTLRPAVEQGRREVIAILDASLADMARAHAVATVVIDATDQQGFGLVACHRVIVALLVELGLHRVKELTIEDGGLLARKHLAFEHNLADIESIAQKMGKRTSGERYPPKRSSGLSHSQPWNCPPRAEYRPSAC